MNLEIQSVPYPKPGPMASRALPQITDEIIHHSAGSIFQTPLEIDEEHRERGMAMIGYNFLISRDGTVSTGRPLTYIPAAAYGRNTESVNICVIGNFEGGHPGYTGPPTPAQIKALTDLSIYLHHQLPSIVRTIGHKDVATLFYPANTLDYATACPGSELYGLLGSVRQKITQQLARL